MSTSPPIVPALSQGGTVTGNLAVTGSVSGGALGFPMLELAAATPFPAGFPLQNATPTILTWTAPNDGKMHRFLLVPYLNVTTAETGGAISITFTDPTNTARNFTIQSGGASAGLIGWGNGMTNWITLPVQPGSTVSVVQSSALTAGAATFYAELWAS